MDQVDDSDQFASAATAASAASKTPVSMRTEMRALIALGWVPSIDEPRRICPLRGGAPFMLTTNEVWSAMHEVLAEDGRRIA